MSSVSFFPGPADLNLMSFLMSSKNFFIFCRNVRIPGNADGAKLSARTKTNRSYFRSRLQQQRPPCGRAWNYRRIKTKGKKL